VIDLSAMFEPFRLKSIDLPISCINPCILRQALNGHRAINV
jgi:hypothetical protein